MFEALPPRPVEEPQYYDGVSRRRFMLGTLGAATGTLLTACSGDRSPSVPSSPPEILNNDERITRAVRFITGNVWHEEAQAAGLDGTPVKSYANPNDPFAHTFDQALALTVLSDRLMLPGDTEALQTAQGIAKYLLAEQNDDGSWHNAYIRGQGKAGEKSAGVVSWVVYALKRYERALPTGKDPVAAAARRAWKWVASQRDPRLPGAVVNIQADYNPPVVVAIAETNEDAWYAAKAMGDEESTQGIFSHLNSRAYTDKQTGSVKKGVRPDGDDNSLGFDAHVWGARLMSDTGRDEDAYRMLGYAFKNFAVHHGNTLAGMYSNQNFSQGVDYEATAQFISIYRSLAPPGSYPPVPGVTETEVTQLQNVLLSAQNKDGGLAHNDKQGSPDMAYPAVNATAWLYWALKNQSPLSV